MCIVELISTEDGQIMETTRQYRNKTVCVGCTERTLVVSFVILLFVLCSASVSALQIVFSNSLYERTAKWETSHFLKRTLLVHV